MTTDWSPELIAQYGAIERSKLPKLAKDEFWCVFDPGDEPILETASKIREDSILRFCTGMPCHWEDAKEVGYYLSKSPPRS